LAQAHCRKMGTHCNPPPGPLEKPDLHVGDSVEIFGLQSASGSQLNGQAGVIARLNEDTGRFEVALECSKVVSVKLENLQRLRGDKLSSLKAKGKAGVNDLNWSCGDPVRVVGLVGEDVDKELAVINGSLGTLVVPAGGCHWFVDVQRKQHKIKVENLRVLTKDDNDPQGLFGCRLRYRVLLASGLLGTLLLLLEAELMRYRVADLSATYTRPVAPGLRVAIFSLAAPFAALMWVVGTMAGCYTLHGPLHDPQVTFPQISELGVGPKSAKALYRIGFTAAAALLGSMVLLHQELATPHLPGGREGEAGAAFTWSGLTATAGVALQGVFLLEPMLSKQTVAHLVGALLFFYGAWTNMGAAQRLYIPGADLPPEDSSGWDEISAAADAAAESVLLQNAVVHCIVRFRHEVLMRAPVVVFIVPLFSQFAERAPSSLPTGACTPSARSYMGLAQWLVVGNFVLIFLSYGPELAVAALLPSPLIAED